MHSTAPVLSRLVRRSSLPVEVLAARRRWAGHAAAALLFAVLTVVLFWPAFNGGAPFSTVRQVQTREYPWRAFSGASHRPITTQGDQAQLSYPWDVALRDALKHGTLPFWNGASFNGGYPLYANGSSGELYPPRLLLAWLDVSPEAAHAWVSALHVFFAGLFAYLFARALTFGWCGAALTGMSWMLASFNIAWLPFAVLAPVMVLLPLNLLLVRRAWHRRTWSAASLAGGVLGITFISGHLLYMSLTVLVALVYGGCLALADVADAWTRERCRATRALAIPAVEALVAAGVGAVVLLPTYLNLQQTSRAQFHYPRLYQAPDVNTSLAPTSALLHTFVPVSTPLTVNGLNREMAFAGAITGALALIGLLSRRPGAGLGRTFVVLAGLGAIGGPVTWLLYHTNPMMRIDGSYGRLLQWWSFGVALLGGLGLDRLLQWLRRSWTRRVRLTRRQRRSSANKWVFGVAGVVLLASAVQLLVTARDLSPSFDRAGQSRPFPRTSLISAITRFQRQTRWPGRVVLVSEVDSKDVLLNGVKVVMLCNIPLVFGIAHAGGEESSVPPRTSHLVRVLGGENIDLVLHRGLEVATCTLYPSGLLRYDLLARTGVAAIVTPPTLNDADNKPFGLSRYGYGLRQRYVGRDGKLFALHPNSARPRVVSEVDVVRDGNASLRTFTRPEYDYQHRVVLERSELERLPRAQRTTRGPRPSSTVTATHVGVNTLTLRGRSSGPGWLVIPQNWDPGWRVHVNGRPAVLLRGNHGQQVLRVPRGRFFVQLAYQPPGFRTGAAVTVATILGAVILAIAEAFRRRGARRPGRTR